MGAKYEVRGSVAVITLDNPPVNGLGYDTRAGIASGVGQAMADPAVVAVVITGGGKAFSGGADIKEFGSPKAGSEPNLLSLIKPTTHADAVDGSHHGLLAVFQQLDQAQQIGF